MKTISRIFGALLLAAVGFAGIWWLLMRTPTIFGSNIQPENQGILVVAYGYAVTLLGVALGSAYRRIREMQARGETSIGKPGRFFRSVFSSLDFWMGLCGSPIVYALIWKSTGGGAVAGLTAIALENGFCCTLILGSLRGDSQGANAH